MMLAAMTKKSEEKEWICPADWRTITQAAEELGVDRSRVVKITKERSADGVARLPVREFLGVQVIQLHDLAREKARDRSPGRRPHLQALEQSSARRRRQ
jgi:hypothetical protein